MPFVATALALGRLADPDGDDWARLGRRRLMDALLGGRYGSHEQMMSVVGSYCVLGPVQRCIDRLAEYIEAGARHRVFLRTR